MIKTKKDLKEYIHADRIAGKYKGISGFLNPVRRYLKRLRKSEYYFNTQKKIRLKISNFFLDRLSVLTGITIGFNSFGKGLYIPHHGYVVVNSLAKFGDYCIVQCGVNVSEDVIGGDRCYLGTGAKLMIGARIGNDVIVGANAVVTKSFSENNVVLAGVPAKIISNKGLASGRSKI